MTITFLAGLSLPVIAAIVGVVTLICDRILLLRRNSRTDLRVLRLLLLLLASVLLALISFSAAAAGSELFVAGMLFVSISIGIIANRVEQVAKEATEETLRQEARARHVRQRACRVLLRARKAQQRARNEEERAKELEWQTDTMIAMESMSAVEDALSVALIRLYNSIEYKRGFVMLRDFETPDAGCFVSAQSFGKEILKDREINRIQTTVVEIEAANLLIEPKIYRPDSPDLPPFLRPTTKETNQVIVVPLRTFDEFVGLLCITTMHPEGFTEWQKRRIIQLAKQIVYPIQRLRLFTLATTDGLTGLLNSRDFRRRLRVETERAVRYAHPLTLLLVDLDHFKRVNDTYGHRAGDEVLLKVSDVLRRHVRGIDIVARYGGEEIAIICPETRLPEATALAERLRIAIAQAVTRLPEGDEVSVTASFGIAVLNETCGEPALLFEIADRALFAAKAAGRNTVCTGDNLSNPLERQADNYFYTAKMNH